MNRASPNVIVLLTDQQRWDTCGLHGNPLGLTPNYDRFARTGTHAARAFTVQPVCGPSRSCIQTGQYATSTGCWRNDLSLPTATRTVAHEFAAAGYHTGYIGKWHLAPTGVGAVPAAHRAGYQSWLASNILEMTSDAYDCRVYDEDNREVRLPGYRVDAMIDAAIRHLDVRSRAGQPFFLFISLLEPHHQNHRDDYPAPDIYREAFAGRWTPPDLAALGGTAAQHLPGYFGMVKRIDEAFGRMLEAVGSLGLADNTVVAFTSDHGCHFKTRNNEYKRSPHDASIRVPMAFNGPGFRGGGELRQLVSLLDLAPTLLDAAGVAVPARMQGRSILPLLRGGDAPWPEEVYVQISETQVGRAIRTSRWKYAVTAPGLDGWAVPGGERYVESALYDLQADPWELTNLAGCEAHAAVAARLRERLLQRLREAGEPAATIEPAPVNPAGQRRVLAGEIGA